jgi:beta-glucanase (GH16 family)
MTRVNLPTLFLLGLLLTLSTVQSQTWVLQWSDEFNEGSIDTSKWTFDIGNGNGWGNNELEYYTDSSDNAFIQNGQLVIQALQQSMDGFQYTSARMLTQGLYSSNYGRWEISAQLPYGQGVWPAFWMLGNDITNVGWPACGEIDIMELVGNDPTQAHGSVHGTGFSLTGAYTNNGGFSSGFHNYSVNWQPGSLAFYVDGVNYETQTSSNVGGGVWPFDAPGYQAFILLNLAIGGDWPGPPNASTTFPQQFIIEYVRVWELSWSNETGTDTFLQDEKPVQTPEVQGNL